MKGHFDLLGVIKSGRISEEVNILQVLRELRWCFAVEFWCIRSAMQGHLELLCYCWWWNLYLVNRRENQIDQNERW